MSMEFEKKLALPMEVKEMYPMTLKMGAIIEEKRAQIQAIFEGRNDRLLLIIGPAALITRTASSTTYQGCVPCRKRLRTRS